MISWLLSVFYNIFNFFTIRYNLKLFQITPKMVRKNARADETMCELHLHPGPHLRGCVDAQQGVVDGITFCPRGPTFQS